MNKKVILFDIDYTLFNTDKFRDITYPKLMQLLRQEDLPQYHEEVKLIEKDLIKGGGYEPVIFARTLAKALQLQPEYDAISKLFYDEKLYDNCLYPEVKDVLNKLSKKEDFILGIISKGENTFQRRKIASINHFFASENIYISLDKFDKIDEIYNNYLGDKLTVIDDSALFLDAVKKKWDAIFTVFMKRESRYERREAPSDFNPDMKFLQLDELLSLL